MSQSYKSGGTVLWNPSNGVSHLFRRTSEAVAPLVDLPTGIGPVYADEYEVDLPVFTAFVEALASRYLRSTHPILRSLTEGFLATAIVMLERGGAEISPPADGFDPRDVSIGPDGLGARPAARRLWDLAAEHSQAMPA